VLPGEVDREIVSKLYRVLDLRNKARYDPDYTPSEADADEMLQIYRELRDIARRILSKESATS